MMTSITASQPGTIASVAESRTAMSHMSKGSHLDKKRNSLSTVFSSMDLSSGRRSRSKSETDEDEGDIMGVEHPQALRGLLLSIYEGLWGPGGAGDGPTDSDTTLTETSTSWGVGGVMRRGGLWKDTSSTCSEAEMRKERRMGQQALMAMDKSEVGDLVKDLQHRNGIVSSRLIRQLKRRDHRLGRLQKKCDILTAILQASSQKRRQDTQLKFTVEPKPGEEAFRQWKDAMRAVARLPLGLPPEFRKKVWLALANQHIASQKYDWDRVRRFAFNDHSNPDDDTLGLQIVKDLHRTGCDRFSSEADRAVLKRVLLAYARWNKRVGYCQGFNVLAALILEVTERQEDDALKVMVYLVDHVLPESYFGQSLQALSVDMAVFRDLLRIQMPDLARHLEDLQKKAVTITSVSGNTRRCYEPPLTNVFTMQWFLTLFATCLPPDAVLRVWDAVLLQGSEVMLRTALAIWDNVADRIRTVDSADLFYTVMGQLTTEMAEGRLIDTESLLQRVYSLAPFPFPGLTELREKYTYDITPFSSGFHHHTPHSSSDKSSSSGLSAAGDTNEEELDDEELNSEAHGRSSSHSGGPGCFAGFLTRGTTSNTTTSGSSTAGMNRSFSAADISLVGPGAVSANPALLHGGPPAAYQERMTTNLSALQAQYQRLRNKQRNTSLVIPGSGGGAGAGPRVRGGGPHTSTTTTTTSAGGGGGTVAINHLLLHRQHGAVVGVHQQRKKRGQAGTGAPRAKVVMDDRDAQALKVDSSAPGQAALKHQTQDTLKTSVSTSSSCCSATSSIASSDRRPSEDIMSQSERDGGEEAQKVDGECSRGQLRSRTLTITSSNVDHLEEGLVETIDLSQASEVFGPHSPPTTAKSPINTSTEQEPQTSPSSPPLTDSYTARWVDSTLLPSPPVVLPEEINDEDEEEKERGGGWRCSSWQTVSPDSLSTTASSSNKSSPNHRVPAVVGGVSPFTLRPQLVTPSRLNFGSKFGLYKAMTQSPGARKTLNDCLHKTYMAQLRRDEDVSN